MYIWTYTYSCTNEHIHIQVHKHLHARIYNNNNFFIYNLLSSLLDKGSKPAYAIEEIEYTEQSKLDEPIYSRADNLCRECFIKEVSFKVFSKR